MDPNTSPVYTGTQLRSVYLATYTCLRKCSPALYRTSSCRCGPAWRWPAHTRAAPASTGGWSGSCARPGHSRDTPGSSVSRRAASPGCAPSPGCVCACAESRVAPRPCKPSGASSVPSARSGAGCHL